MKALKKKIIIGIILATTIITSTASANHAGVSNDTPNRPGIAYVQGMEGLSYPSFNSFTGNPNIMSADPVNDPHPTHGDEREFFVGRKCLNYECSTSGQRYFNEEQDVLSEGDTVRFAIYYHNNGEDPYNGDNGSAHAQNVEIGIDLNDIVDPSNNLILRPEGFIHADNNEYRTTIAGYNTNASTQIIDEAGNIVRTATDDMRLLLQNSNLELVPIEGRTSLATVINKDTQEWFYEQIESPTNVTWNTDNSSTYSTEVDTHYDQESSKMWISFDELPGCFNYSGFVYIDAVVVEKPVEPNVCEDLTLATPRELTAAEVQDVTSGTSNGPLYELTLDNLAFHDGTIPAGTTIQWRAIDEANPVFWTPAFGGYIGLPGDTTTTTAVLPPGNNKVIFEGSGAVSVEVITTDPDLNSPECQGRINIQENEQVCDELQVNHEDLIYEDRLSIFNAKSLDTYGDTFKGKITYSVEAGHGTFYLSDPGAIVYNTTVDGVVEVTEFDASGPIATPDGGWCGPENTTASNTPGRTGFPGIDLGNTYGTVAGTSGTKYDIDFTDVVGKVSTDLSAGYTAEGSTNEDGTTKKPTDKTALPDIPGTALPDFTTTDIIGISTTVASDQNSLFEKYDSKEFYKVPDWLSTGVEPKPKAIDTDSLKTSIFNLLEANALTVDPNNFQFEISPDFTANYQPMATIIANPFALDIALEPEFDGALFLSAQSITVDPGTEVYFAADEPGNNVIKVSTECTEEEDCVRYFDVTPLERSCEAITLECDPNDPSVGDDVTCSITASEDSEGDPLPETTEFLWNTDTDCTFSDPNNIGGATTHLNTLLDQPVTCSNPLQPGKVFVTINNTDELYSSICSAEIEVVDDLVCEDLTLYISQFGEQALENQLAARMIYSVSAAADYSEAHVNTVTLSVDEAVGRFLTDITADQFISLAALVPPIGDLTLSDLESIFTADQIHTSVIADELELVTLVTFSEVTNVASAVSAVATGYEDSEECSDDIGLEEELVCENLSIVEDGDCYSITGDFSDHDGDIIACADEGQLGKEGAAEDEFDDCVTFTQEEVAASGNELKLECIDTEGATISVEALGSEDQECSDIFVPEDPECIDLQITTPSSPWETDEDDDEQEFEIQISTSPASLAEELNVRWETTDGKWEVDGEDEGDEFTSQNLFVATLIDFEGETPEVTISALNEDGSEITACVDSIEPDLEEEKTPPEIGKFVYPVNAFNDADDNIINIAEPDATPYVTYMLVVNLGDDVEEIDIKDENITASGRILGNQAGFLQFEELAIFVIDGDEEKSIYTSPGYHHDALNPSGAYAEFHDDNLDPIKDTDAQKAEFDCDGNENDFCLDNFDSAFGDFAKGATGNGLQFKNVDKLDLPDPDDSSEDFSKIVIKYEMSNHSIVDGESCKDISKAAGCGEAFYNLGSFDSENNEYDDSDDAEVIVVCPYILTRQGGDVFFHDVIDTGAEAAYCSEFKGGDGPGIVPVPVPKQTTPSTGEGDIEDGDANNILSLDTHDICNYSNLDTNIEGYNNVLSNFSSTVCELQATVAETWTEQYINNAITANLIRVSRWGSTLTGNTNLTSINSITSDNPSSGIYVSIGQDITIDGNGNYIVEAGGEIPAGQTYIVQNANININTNIVYGQTDFSNPDEIPSAAFIVIDGNINIAPGVTELHGVFMAVDSDQSGNDGQVISTGPSDEQLTIYGNLIGNVYSLFTNRTHVGNASQDEGSVVIHYDERILLNTPPGIGELVSVEYALVPN